MNQISSAVILAKDVTWALKAHRGELAAEEIARKIKRELGFEYKPEEVEAALRLLINLGSVETRSGLTYRWIDDSNPNSLPRAG